MSIDCTKMSDTDLMAMLSDANAELTRRSQFRAIPGQVAAMTTQYVADGGKRTDLATAVEKAPEPSEKNDPPPPAPTGSTGTPASSSSSSAQVGATLGAGR